MLGGPRDFPSLRVSNLLVAPGRETWVEVKPSDDNGCADDGDGPVVFMWRQRYSNGYSDISRYSLDLASQVTPLVVTSHPSLSSLSPTSRGCLLPHESDLDHHAAYSVSRLWSLLSLFFVLVSIVFVFYDLPFFILACS